MTELEEAYAEIADQEKDEFADQYEQGIVTQVKRMINEDPFADNGTKKLILDKWELSGNNGETLLVTLKVGGFTAESKAGPYSPIRGYAQIEPENLKIHVPVHNPGQEINESGDIGIFRQVFGYVARQLDMAVVDVYNRRLDQEVIEKDLEMENTGITIKGKGVSKAKDSTNNDDSEFL